jgi:excisionase family DNA binding protein
MTPHPKLLTTGEVARAYGVSTSAVRRWVKAGRLPGFQTPTGQLRVRASDVEDLIAASSVVELPAKAPSP